MKLLFTHTGQVGDYFTAAGATRLVGRVFDVVGPDGRVHRGVVVAARPLEGGTAVQLEVVFGVEVIVRVPGFGRPGRR